MLLFFEGFNIANTDQTPFLDPRYWTRPSGEDIPYIEYANDHRWSDTNYNIYDPTLYSDDLVYQNGTNGCLRISGYRLDTTPPQQSSPIQLSGVSGLDSDQLYISFRINNLGHNATYGINYPYTTKLMTLNSGNKELLSFDVVRTTGLSVQGGTWDYPTQGLGISVKQTGSSNSMVQIGLFDLRVFGINDYYITNDNDGSNNASTAIKFIPVGGSSRYPRFVHLEFFLNSSTNNIRMKVEGFDVLNKLGQLPLKYAASGKLFGKFDNIKFYNKGIISDDQDSLSRGRGAIVLDDLAICNNSGNAPNTWMGPNTRIINMSRAASSPAFSEWTSSNGSNNTRLDSNDGDNSYISSDISGQIYSYRLKSANMNDPGNTMSSIFKDTDNIGGIRIFNSVRKAFLDSDFTNIYSTGSLATSDSNSYINIGEYYQIDHTDYVIRNSFINNDPTTDSVWLTGNFLNFGTPVGGSYPVLETTGYFGVKKL